MVTSISFLAILSLGNYLRKKGFGDMLSATKLTRQITSHEMINLNPFKDISSKSAKDLWSESQNIYSVCNSVEILYSFLKRQLFYFCARLEENNG
jgi:hypothetical protein